MLFEPLPVLHGRLEIYGYRFGGCAYIPDVSSIPERTIRRLKGLNVLIIDALRPRPSHTHLSVGQALEIVRQVEPGHTYFTHICHDMRHSEVAGGLRDPSSPYFSSLPVSLAYDGLSLELDSGEVSEEG